MNKSKLITILIVFSALVYANDSGRLIGKILERETGEALGGVIITILQNGQSIGISDTSSSEGIFYFPDVPRGIYDLEFKAEDRRRITIRDVSISSYRLNRIEGNYHWIRLVYPYPTDPVEPGKYGSIKGQIIHLMDGEHLEDIIVVLTLDSIESRYEACTDENGNYEIPFVPVGEYSIRAWTESIAGITIYPDTTVIQGITLTDRIIRLHTHGYMRSLPRYFKGIITGVDFKRMPVDEVKNAVMNLVPGLNEVR